MMDVPDYAEGVRHKKRAYLENGIAALFLYPRDLAGPHRPEQVAERIEKAGQQAVAYGHRQLRDGMRAPYG